MYSIFQKMDDVSIQRARKVLKNVSVILVLGILYLIFFRIFGVGIPCVFRLITGLKCPGCGMTHAFSEIATGDIASAFESNALSVTMLPLLLVYGIIKTVRYINKGEEELTVLEVLFLAVCLIACVAYFVYRNFLI